MNGEQTIWHCWYQEWPIWAEPIPPPRHLREFKDRWAALAFKEAVKGSGQNVVACVVPSDYSCIPDNEVWPADIILDDDDEETGPVLAEVTSQPTEKLGEVVPFPRKGDDR